MRHPNPKKPHIYFHKGIFGGWSYIPAGAADWSIAEVRKFYGEINSQAYRMCTIKNRSAK